MTLAEALATDNRKALQVEIDKFLRGQDATQPHAQRMEGLRQWIEAHDGVACAEVSPDLLDTEPSVQIVLIWLDSDPDTIKTIGVVLDPKDLRFNY